MSLEGVFDASGAVPRPSYLRLLQECWAIATDFPAPPGPADFPAGGDHAVLVLPAFLTDDLFTAPLRRFLGKCGYRVFGWNLGLNLGPSPRIRDALRRRLAEVHAIEQGPVSVIGVSLGGVLARDLAYDRPEQIRRVITIVSPFRLPTASTIEPLVRLCAAMIPPAADFSRLTTPLPVPSTAIYTRDDGIVAWESCRCDDADCDAVEVRGPHLSICRNPAALAAVARGLARKA